MRHPDADAPREVLHEGRWLRLVQRGRWEYAERVHGGGMAVIIVAVTPDDEVLFVEQFRIPWASPPSRCRRAWSATTATTTRWPKPRGGS